ncbi:Aspartic peptidase domain superfamily [Arabidopsis suecica]|uniref:Aspartic peptidase domain superfamily n=1 Tax=Arabidopsis suecica TaxID=45249 RepID=A0A8T2BQT4_ARASU|nr:Aspartic peptidase domain superfamily [Arabidopsis suecica]
MSLPLTNLLVATTPSDHAPAPPAKAHVSLLPDLAVVTTLAAALQITNFIFDCGATFLLKGLASGTVGMAGMGRHNIGLPPQFAAAFSFSQKFAVRNPQSILTAIKIVEKKQFQRLKINASIGFGGTKISSVNPYTVLESSIYKAFTSEFVKQTAARNITRVASEKPFGDACFSTKNVGVTRLGYAAPEIQLLLRSNDVVWRIFRANSMVSVSDDVICLGFVDGVNLCGVHIDCTVLVLFIFSPSSSAQPSFRPKALLLPVAKDQSTLQYTTVINQHIPLVPASVVFDLGGRELWVDCDKDYVSSTYQSPRCNYAECSRAGSTSCGTCFSPPRPGCRLASGTVGMAGMGRHNIGLPPQFAAAFSFSQKFAVRNPQSILTAIKIVEKKQFQRLKINASIGFGGTKISSVNPYTVLESSIYKAFTSEFVKQTAARNITRVASEKPFGDACFSTKNVGVTRLGYAAPEIQLLLRSNDVVWRIFRANSMVSVSDDVICLGFVDGVNLCGVHIDCTVLVLFIFSPSSSAQPSFRPKALLLPVAKDQSTLQYTTVINQHIPLVPASVVFDLGGRELWVDCDKDYVSSTYQSPRCNYAECSRAGSTSCGTCFSPPRPGCRLASGTVGMAGMGRHNIGLPPQFAAAFSFSQKFAVRNPQSILTAIKIVEKKQFQRLKINASIGFGGTKISSVNPYTVLESSIYKAFTSEFVKQTAARNITRVASEKPFGDACFSTKNVGVTRLGYAAPEIQLLLRSNDVVWRIFRANSMVSVSDDVICLGFVDGVNLCGVHIDCTVLVLFIFSPSSSAQPSFRPKALLLPVAKDQSTLQYTTVINQHIPLVPASVVFDLGGRELWVDCDKDYVSSTYQSPRCNYAECSRAGSTSCGTCFSPPRPGCRLASGTVGMAGMGRHNIGLPPQFAAAFSFSQKFAVRNPQSILTAIKIVEKKQFQRLKINASIGFGGTKISSVNPYTVLESSIYKAFTSEFVKQTAARNITRVASEKPFGDACFSTKNVGVTRLGYAAPEIQLLLRSNDVVWRIFRANSMVSVSDDVICLGFVDGVNLCGVHIDCTVLVLFIFSPSSSAQPSFRPKALLLPVAKDQSTLQYTTVINQHIPLVPASVVFDLGGRELWVDCDKDYVSSTYQSPRCNYAECSRAGSTSCGTCFSPPRPGCSNNTCGGLTDNQFYLRLSPNDAASHQSGEALLLRFPKVRNPQSILTAIKIVEKKQFQRLKINASIGFGGTKISSVNPYTVLESSIYKAFTSEFVKQTAARNITRVASEKPFGDACFSTKNVGVTRLGYAAPEIQLLLRSNDVVWRIFRANSMVSVSDDVICLGFVDGVNLCGVHIDCTVLVLFIFSPSSSAQPSFRPKALLLPVAKDQSTLQYTTVINQHIPLVPASVVFDLGGRELWVDCDKDYVSSTYQSPRCNYAECSRAGSTSCGTCFSPPRPGCSNNTCGGLTDNQFYLRLSPNDAASHQSGEALLLRFPKVRNPQSILTAIKIVEKKQFQRLKINASIGFGGTKISSVNPYTVLESSIYKAFTSEFVKQTAARNITRVASEKPFGDACFSTKNVGVTRLGYAAPEIQLLLRSNDVVWRIFRANSMVSVSDDVICLGFVDGVNLCGVHIDCTVLVLFIFSPSSSAQPSFRPKALLLPVAKDQSTLQYTTVINQHIPLVPASVVFDLGGRELWVDCDKDYVSSTYQSPRCNYAECSRAGSTSCGTCFSPPRPGCRLASGTVGMAGMGRHNIGLPPQFAAAFSFSQKFAVCLIPAKYRIRLRLFHLPISSLQLRRAHAPAPPAVAHVSLLPNLAVVTTLAAALQITNFIFDCGATFLLKGLASGTVGIAGMGRHNIGLPPQFAAAFSFSQKFAVCLTSGKGLHTMPLLINPVSTASAFSQAARNITRVASEKPFGDTCFSTKNVGVTRLGYAAPEIQLLLRSNDVVWRIFRANSMVSVSDDVICLGFVDGVNLCGVHIDCTVLVLFIFSPSSSAQPSFRPKALLLPVAKDQSTLQYTTVINQHIPLVPASVVFDLGGRELWVDCDKDYVSSTYQSPRCNYAECSRAGSTSCGTCFSPPRPGCRLASGTVGMAGMGRHNIGLPPQFAAAFSFSQKFAVRNPQSILTAIKIVEKKQFQRLKINASIGFGGTKISSVNPYTVLESSIYKAFTSEFVKQTAARNITRVASEKPFGDACFSTKNVGVTRLGYAAPEIQLLLRSNDVVWRIFRANSMVSVSDDVICLGFVDGVNLCGVHIDCTVLVLFIFSPSSSAQPSFRPKALLLPVAKDQSTLQYTTVINQHIPLVPASVVFDLGGRELWVDCDKDYVSSTYQSPRCNYAECSRAGSTSCGTCFSPPRPGCRLASGTVGMAGMGRHNIGLPPQFAAAFSFSQKFAVRNPQSILTAIKIVEKKQFQRLKINASIGFGGTKISSVNPYTVLESSIYKAFTSEFVKQTAARNITRVASEKPFGDACFSTKNVGVTRLGYAAPEIQLLLRSNDVVWRIFRANSMVSVSDDVICLGFVDGVNLCGVHIDCTVLVLFIFSPSSSAQPSFRPKALLLPVAKDQSTLQYTTVINQHIPLVPASVVFDLGGRELWVDCDKDYVSSTYQSPRCNYAECSRAGSTSCGTCFSPPRPGCRLASGTVGMAGMGRHNIGLPPQFAAAFSFSQKFAVRNPQSILTAIKIVEKKQFQRLKINASIGFGGTKISSVNPYTVLESSIYKAFTSEFVKQTAARNITRVASEKPFGDACFSTKNVGVTRLGYAAPEIQLLLRSNDVVWRIFRANSMVSVSDDVICLGFVDGVNLCGVHIDCTVLVLFIFSPSSSAQPSFRPKALLLPVAKDQSTLQYTTVINQHIPLVPASVVFDLGGRELWVDCDKDYVSSTYQSPRCNYAECSRAGSTSCGTCFSPPRPGCRLASGTVGMAGMGRHNIGLPPQFAAAFSFSQKFAVRNPQSILTAIKIVEKKQFQRLKINASIGFGGTKISSVNPYTVLESSIYKAFTSEFVKQTAARNITRVASEKPFGDACFSTKNVGVTRLGYAAPEIQLLLRSNDVVWRIFRANSMVSVSDDVICLGFVDGVNLCGVHIDCTVLVLFIFSPSSSAQPSFRPKALLLPVAKDQSTLQYTTVINQHIPLVPASVVFDLGGRELWVDCDKDYVSSTYQSPRCNYAECSRAGSTSCGTCFSPPRPGCRLASGTVGMAGMGRHNIGLPPQFAAAFSFSQKFAVRNPQSILTAIKIVEKKQFQRLKINASIGFGGTKISSVNPYTVLESSIYKAFTSEFVKQTAARNITRVASEKPFGDACFSTKNVGVTRLGYAAPEIQLLLRSNDVVWRIFRANSMVSVSDDVICLGFVDGVNLCGVHIDCTVLVLFIFSPSSSAQPSFRPKALLLPVAKDQSTLQYTTVINQHIPLVPASVVFDLGGRELWVDCDKDYVSSTYQSPRCNYAECSRAGSTSCGTCFSPPRPGCRLASGTVGMAGMGRHNIGLPPQFAAAFSFSQKFAVRNPQSILTAIKIVEKKQFQRLKINASIGFGGTKISSVNPYTVLESSIYKAFTSEFVKQTAARNITRVASEKPFGDACFSTKNVGVTRLGYAAPEIQLLLRSNDVVWRIFRANSMVSVSDDVICLGFVDGVNLCGVHIDCTVLVLFIFSPSSSAQPSFRPKALLLPVAKDQSTLQYTTVINQHIPLVPASVVFDLGGRELWVDCDKDYVSSTYQSPRCNYAECSTSCGTCFSPPRPGCRLASGTVGMAGMGRHNIGLPPQFAAAFSFSQKFAVCLIPAKVSKRCRFSSIRSVNPYTVLESSIYKAFTSEFVKQTAARNITRVASEKPFGDACFSTKNVGVTRLGYAAPEIQLLLRSNDVVWRIFRANSMVSVSDDVICLGFVDGVNLCGVHIDCTVLVLFIFSPSSSAQPSFRPKALLLPVAKDQSTLQYTTVINQHIPLVPASVVFDLGGRELWVDCDKDYVSSTYQSPRCNYAECSRAGSTSCGTCFSPPRPGCRLASGTVGMAGMGRHNIGLPPQFAAAFSFSQKFAVRNPQSILTAIKIVEKKQFQRLKINASIGFGGTKISSVNPYTVLESSIYKAFTSEFVKQTAARNITRVASEKPFGDACFSTKNVGVTRLDTPRRRFSFCFVATDVVWRIFRANSMVSVSDDVICLGFVDGVNLCGVHIDCTVLVLFIFSPSSSAQPSFRPKALLLPVAKDQSTLQYTTVINQHIPLVPASVVFDLGGRELWVDCDKDYVSSTYQSPRCNYAECSRAGSTSCGTCFSPPRPGCRLASGTVGMAGMGRHNIGLPPQFSRRVRNPQSILTAIKIVEKKQFQRLKINASIGFGGTKISSVNPYTVLESSIYKAFTSEFVKQTAARNITRVASEKPFGDACFSTKNVGVTCLGYAAPEIQLLLRVHIDCTVLVLFIFSPSSSAQPSFRPKALFLPVAKDQSTLQYTTVINQHIPLVPASVVFDLGGRELWVDCDKDYVSSTYQSPRCNYAECSRAGSTSCGTCFSPPRPGCRLASGTVGMAGMGRHNIGLPPQFTAAFSFSQKFAVRNPQSILTAIKIVEKKQFQRLKINASIGFGGTKISSVNPYTVLESSIYKAFMSEFVKQTAARNITRVASEKPFGDACFSTKNVGVTCLGYAAPEIQLLLRSNDVVWRIFRANSMVSISDDVICLGFVDGVNLCGVHIDCTVLVLFIFSPSSSAQPSFRPKALFLPVAKDQSTLQYTTVINQHIPLVPASVVFDLGGRELWVDCDKDYVSSTYQSPRCNYAECSRAGSTSCGTCFSPPRPGCRLASGTVGMAGMGRHNIGLPPQFAAAFSFSQKFAVRNPQSILTAIKIVEKKQFQRLKINASIGFGGTKISSVNPYTVLESSIYKAFTSEFVKQTAAWNITRVASEKPFGDACFSTKNVGVTCQRYAAPEIQLLLRSNDVVWTIFRANSMVSVTDDVICLGFVDGVNLCGDRRVPVER